MPGRQIHTPVWIAGTVLAGVLIVGGLAGALTVSRSKGLAPVFTVAASSTEQGRIGETFAPIVRAEAPAVVNISSSKTVRAPSQNLEPLLQDPFFRRFFGDQLPELFRAPRDR